MIFISIVLALLFEQVRPLPLSNPVYEQLRQWTRWCARQFDTNQTSHSGLAWGIAVIVPTVGCWFVYWLLGFISLTIGQFVWMVVVVYLTTGFRQFSHYFTAIVQALYQGDKARARELLVRWLPKRKDHIPQLWDNKEIMRYAIEYGIVAAHRHVFGVLFWFVLGASLGLGPSGAVLYRLSEYAARDWLRRSKVQIPSALNAAYAQAAPIHPSTGVFDSTSYDDIGFSAEMDTSHLGAEDTPLEFVSANLVQWSQWLWFIMDWPAVRATAISGAIVGSFDGVVLNWRQYRTTLAFKSDITNPTLNDGLLLTALVGALGVHSEPSAGMNSKELENEASISIFNDFSLDVEDDLPPSGRLDGAPALNPTVGKHVYTFGHLRGIIALVWRIVVFWLVVLAVLTVVHLLK